MIFDYEGLLERQLYSLQNELEITNYNFIVEKEQEFMKRKDLAPNTIYVLTRMLENDNSIGVDTQPVQVLVLTEQNEIEVSKSFFTEFAKRYNFKAYAENYAEDGEIHNIWVKQQYSDPVVLSNFNVVDYGYRSVLYIATNLYIMYDIVDLKELKIDGTKYDVLNWNLSYNMTPNVQQTSGTNNFIAKSVKSVSSLAINFTIPPVESLLLTKVLSIVKEDDATVPSGETDTTAYGGNENFSFNFKLGTVEITKKMKLVLLEYETAINNIPAIRLGFVK